MEIEASSVRKCVGRARSFAADRCLDVDGHCPLPASHAGIVTAVRASPNAAGPGRGKAADVGHGRRPSAVLILAIAELLLPQLAPL
jgi:hypothetical protein